MKGAESCPENALIVMVDLMCRSGEATCLRKKGLAAREQTINTSIKHLIASTLLCLWPGDAAQIILSGTSHGSFLLEKAQLRGEAVGTPEIGSHCQSFDQVLLVGEMGEKGIDIDRRYGHR
jgi:hypothetical protein